MCRGAAAREKNGSTTSKRKTANNISPTPRAINQEKNNEKALERTFELKVRENPAGRPLTQNTLSGMNEYFI
jgi:hypothetical protein